MVNIALNWTSEKVRTGSKMAVVLGVIAAGLGAALLLSAMDRPDSGGNWTFLGAVGFISIISGLSLAFVGVMGGKSPTGNLKQLYILDLTKVLTGFPLWMAMWLLFGPAMDALTTLTASLTPEAVWQHPGLFPCLLMWFGSYIQADLMGLEELVYVLTLMRIPCLFQIANILLALYFDRKNNWWGRAILFSLALIPFTWMWLETFSLLPLRYGLLDGTIDKLLFFNFSPLITVIELVSQLTLHLVFLYTAVVLWRERPGNRWNRNEEEYGSH